MARTKMKLRFSAQEFEVRKPVCEALSAMFLDDELQEDGYQFIAQLVIDSSLSPQQISTVLWCELFPVLAANLTLVAGEWAGSDLGWLADNVQKKKRFHGRLGVAFRRLFVGNARAVIEESQRNVSVHLPSEITVVANPG